MNILFTYELARRWAGTNLSTNTLHPGWPLQTNLGRELQGVGAMFDRASKLVAASAASGARTSLYLAGSPELAGTTGGYFARSRPAKSSALSHDHDTGRRLWTISADLCAATSTTTPRNAAR